MVASAAVARVTSAAKLVVKVPSAVVALVTSAAKFVVKTASAAALDVASAFFFKWFKYLSFRLKCLY